MKVISVILKFINDLINGNYSHRHDLIRDAVDYLFNRSAKNHSFQNVDGQRTLQEFNYNVRTFYANSHRIYN